jgi:hypothetical protein
MTLFSVFTFLKGRGMTVAGFFSVALCSVLLLCGAGSAPIENLLPQGAMQGDLNAGGHNLTNAATVNATNVAASGSLIGPLNGTNIVSGSVANSQLATMAANTVKANNTGSTAAPVDVAANTVLSIPRLGFDANGTALHTTTGAYNGQLAMSKDGFFSRWTGSAWSDVFVFGDTVGFGADGGTNPFMDEYGSRSDGGLANLFQQSLIAPTGIVYYDNALNIGNASTHGGAVTTGTTNGTTTITLTGSTAGIVNGMTVTSSTGDIPANDTITISGTTVTLSAAATGSHSGETLTFAGYHGFAALSFCDDVLNGGILGHGGPALGMPADEATMTTGGYAHTFFMDTSSLDSAADLTNVYDLGFGTFANGNTHRQIKISNWDSTHDVLFYGFDASNTYGTLSACVNGVNGYFLVGTRTPVGTSPLQVSGVALESGVTSSFVGADSTGKHVATTTTLGDLPYAGASGVPSRLAGNTTSTPQLLTQTGTGSVSAAPTWGAPNTIKGLPRLGVDANGTTMLAATGSFAGQLGVTQDGYLAWWNGSNWTSTFNLGATAFAAASAKAYAVSGTGPGATGIPSLGQTSFSGLTGSTGDFNGQLGMTTDGHFSRWNGSSWTGGFNFGGPLNDNTNSNYGVFFSDVYVYGHLQSAAFAPNNAMIAAGTGAGTSPTVTLDSQASDICGTISVTTGSAPSASATVATVTFFAPYLVAPHVILTPHNGAAAALSGATQVFGAGETTAHFTITSGSSALAASTAYQWNYHVIQ